MINGKQNRVVFLGLWLLFVLASGARGAEIIDADGQRLDVAKPFRRIVSLYPAHTENLFSLGLDREIIGVSSSDDYPAAARLKPKFSYREDAEKFLAATPDLVLVRPMISRGYADLIAKLRQAGIVVVSLQPKSVAEMYDYWRILGVLTGRPAEAAAMIETFTGGVAGITALAARVAPGARKKVYFEAIHAKMKTFAPTSMAIFALTTAGGLNVAADARPVRSTNIAAYGKERILARADEIEIYLAQTGRMNRVRKIDIVEEPGFQAIRAIKDGWVYLIDEKIISRPTLRMLEGIRRIGAILYPELFKDYEVSKR